MLLDTDPAAIAQTELLASVLFLLRAVHHPSQMVSLISKPSHAILLLNTLHWLSAVTRIKTKTLKMAQDHVQFVPSPTLQPAPIPSALATTISFLHTLFPYGVHMLVPLLEFSSLYSSPTQLMFCISVKPPLPQRSPP